MDLINYKKNNIKSIQVNEITVEVINQITRDFLDNVIQNESVGIEAAKNVIQIECEKITLNFVELVQLYIDENNILPIGTTLKYQLFKNQFNQVMQNTRFGFFEFIYAAWSKVIQTLYLAGNIKTGELFLVLLGEISLAHKSIMEENKKPSENINTQTEQNVSMEFSIGKYILNTNSRVLKFDNEVQKLTTKELQLLELLALNKNEVLLRTEALTKIWHENTYQTSRSMDVYITRLRKHLKNDAQIEILNVHGKGFKLLITAKS